MRKVTLTYAVSDNCDVGLVPVITVTSDQQERDRDWWWHHPDIDWKVLDANHVLLRAEIEPSSKGGRTYTITLTVTDSAGTSTSSSVDAKVVHRHPRWDWGRDEDRDDDK